MPKLMNEKKFMFINEYIKLINDDLFLWFELYAIILYVIAKIYNIYRPEL